ncbi:hypothetical protein C8R47DRAFT_1156725 [Mycena vitilis]|nr:hypothetical protein C8R47DRAFT_1156725 [Mycena vitilis]
MDSRRAQTLEALASFVKQQKAILASTQSTIDALRRLKSEAVVADVGLLADQLSGSAFRLSEQTDCESKVPESIDWALFAEKDPKPLQELASVARTDYEQRNKPHTTQRSELSDLQKFVKEAKRTILDPALALYGDRPEDEEMPEAPPKDPQKQVPSDACARPLTIRMPARGPSGLFTRRTAPTPIDIDIDIDTTASPTAINSAPSSSTTASPLCRSPPSPKAVPIALAKPVRARRISTKLQHQNLDRSSEPIVTRVTRARRKSSAVQHKPPPEPEPEPEPESEPEPEPELPPPPPPTVLGKRSRKSAATRPDSYKVMWSASEQNLLERLLEEIPATDPRRFSKISVAMNGRRTPRQVSSRVQKYLQKLKQFGLEGK